MQLLPVKYMVLVILVYSLLLAGCPKDSALKRTATLSYQLSGLTNDVIAATGQAFAQGLITRGQKDAAGNLLKKIAIGGERINQGLKLAASANTNSVKMNLLAIFDSEVNRPFLELLVTLKIVSDARALFLKSQLDLLGLAIAELQAEFNKVAAVIPAIVPIINTGERLYA